MISPRGEYGGYNGSSERRIARGQCGRTPGVEISSEMHEFLIGSKLVGGK
jgi:hypothetical protein